MHHWMYTADCNEAGHMISGWGALLEPCLPNAFNILSHSTLSRGSKRECVYMHALGGGVNYVCACVILKNICVCTLFMYMGNNETMFLFIMFLCVSLFCCILTIVIKFLYLNWYIWSSHFTLLTVHVCKRREHPLVSQFLQNCEPGSDCGTQGVFLLVWAKRTKGQSKCIQLYILLSTTSFTLFISSLLTLEFGQSDLID